MKSRSLRWAWIDDVETSVSAGEISWRAGCVAHVIAVRYANGNADTWPSQDLLVAYTGCSLSTVRRGLRELEEQQLITVKKGRPGVRAGNIYTLTPRPR